jgi:hypothetical protein
MARARAPARWAALALGLLLAAGAALAQEGQECDKGAKPGDVAAFKALVVDDKTVDVSTPRAGGAGWAGTGGAEPAAPARASAGSWRSAWRRDAVPARHAAAPPRRRAAPPPRRRAALAALVASLAASSLPSACMHT